MMRIIDAEVLMSKISRMLDYCQDNKLENEMSTLFQCGDAVIDCPTIDPEELRPKGEWIEDGYTNRPCVCSHCVEEAYYKSVFEEKFDYDWDENLYSNGYEELREYIKSNYCPNCGAKMEDK